MWWRRFLRHLKAYLESRPEFNDVDKPVYIQAGATRQNPKQFPTVYLLRYQDRDLDFHMMKSGTNFLWLEMWIRNDSTDTEVAYDQMEELEELVYNVLHDWVKLLPKDLGVAVNLKIPSWKGDGDTIRPNMVSQLTLEINWKRVS